MSTLPATKKSLGQHWLTDHEILEAICQAAAVIPSDTILEIGPGPGALTERLVTKANQVVAVELDKTLASQLSKRITQRNLQVIEEDILHFDLTKLPTGYKVVANIPYYLTAKLIRVLSESTNPPVCAVLLVQKEVAERVAAAPGKMSALSVSAQFYWEVSRGIEVAATLFTPPPKVDSQVLILKRRLRLRFPDVNIKTYFRLVKAGFAGRRKTLLNSLSGGLAQSKTDIAQLLAEARLSPNLRAQNLSLDDWYRLYQVYKNT